MATNIVQNVQTYQMSQLALLTNLNCFIGTANTRFKNFDKITSNRGDTVTFDLPPRFVSNDTLTAVFQNSEQRVKALAVTEARNVAYEFTNEEFIFNTEDYMERFGKSAVAELGTFIESSVAERTLEAYRFFGDGVTEINSYGQLASALARFRNYGAAQNDVVGYLSDIVVADIINSGLNQFTIDRNNTIANSWMVGDFSGATWCRSNLLPLHISGNTGRDADLLTFVSINAAGDEIVFDGVTGGVANAVFANDLFEFIAPSDLTYLTFIGHKPSANRVQFRAKAPANSVAGQVTILIEPALLPLSAGANANLSRPLVFNDVAKGLPNHRRGMIIAGKALYLAIPKLADQYPFPTGNEVDPDTGISLRLYYGSTFGQNQRGFVNDVIWGSTIVPEYAMALIFKA